MTAMLSPGGRAWSSMTGRPAAVKLTLAARRTGQRGCLGISGQGGGRVLSALGATVSRHTVLRVLLQIPLSRRRYRRAFPLTPQGVMVIGSALDVWPLTLTLMVAVPG